MRRVVARSAQPGQVGFHVIPGLAAKFSVVRVNPGAELAALTGLTDVEQAEEPE